MIECFIFIPFGCYRIDWTSSEVDTTEVGYSYSQHITKVISIGVVSECCDQVI